MTNMELSKPRMVADRSCQFSELESVSFVTLFVLPEADAASGHSVHEVEERKRPSLRTIEKDKLHAVLRTFLESIQVCPSQS